MNKSATLIEFQEYPFDDKSDEDYVSKLNNMPYFHFREKTINQLETFNSTNRFLYITRKSIKPLNYVGVVKAGDITIEILPKFISEAGRGLDSKTRKMIAGNLLKMLQLLENWEFKEADLSALLEEKSDFIEVFIYLFAKNLIELLNKHFYREYVRKYDEIKYIRGRIIIKKYLNPARYHLIWCEHYERMSDNLLCRTLKYTAYLMTRIVRNNENYRLLKHIINLLEPVSLVSISPEKARSIRFNRLNKEFAPFIRICITFIEGLTYKLCADRVEMFSLLIPMEVLFERFIAYIIKSEELYIKIFGDKFHFKEQYKIGSLLWKYSALSENYKAIGKMSPDIVIDGDNERIIIDTKYKLLDEEDKKLGISQQDLYQMYAYARESELPVKKVLLLYPQEIIENKQLKEYFKLGRSQEIDLYVSSISLNYNLLVKEEYDKFVEEFKNVLQCLK